MSNRSFVGSQILSRSWKRIQTKIFPGLLITSAFLMQNSLHADNPAISPGKTSSTKETKRPNELTFGTMRSMNIEIAQAQSETWLKSVGKFDQKAFDAIWKTGTSESPSVLDRVCATFKLGNPVAAQLLTEANNASLSPPQAVPALFKDSKQTSFFRANLAVAYARLLTQHRVYEEALAVLKTVTPEQVVEPSTYLFSRAVAEHGLIQKTEACNTILRLLDEVQDVPERHKMVASIMFFDLQGWKKDEKDLGNIAKLMDNVERRLDLGRGGKETQEIQKKIVFRLDELIKEKENQLKGGQCNGGNCPNGGKQGNKPGSNPSRPQDDSLGGNRTGTGKETQEKLRQLTQNWGKLNEKERAEAMTEINKELPPKFRVVVEEYFKQLSRSNP